MAWSPPELKRRKWFVEQTRDYAINLLPPPSRRHLKRGVFGNFHSISEAHLHRYLAEFDFRANTRNMSDWERAAALLVGAKGKRLTYQQSGKAENG